MTGPILLVEDNADDVLFLRKAFQKIGWDPDLRVETDGHSALRYLRHEGSYADLGRFPDPSRLILEITESLIKDADAHAPALQELREMGVGLALDDFGTGYSALSYLRTLPLDILKIAKPFVEGMARGSQETSFVRMIIDLARALDLRVVAEGIESEEELEALRDLDCELGQGFYLAVPLDLTSDPRVPDVGVARAAR